MQLSASHPGLGASLMLAALALPAVQPAQAEAVPEHGTVSYKLLDYADSQPGDPRIKVRAQSLLISAPIAGPWLASGTATTDAISGASPAYHTSGLGQMHDHRRALDLSATRYFQDHTLTLGVNVSSESDYLSRGWSLQGSRFSEDRNTTWTLGLGVNNDVINPSNHAVDHDQKHVIDLLAGVTQVLGTHDIAQLNLGASVGRGDFSDPYKVFDKRPRHHDHQTLLARWNHHGDSTGSTARWSYRYYTDNYGVHAHTLGLEWVQPLAGGWTITPLARLYTQSAARFYVPAGEADSPFAPNPPADATYSTEDQRLSAYGGHTWGLKLAKLWASGWQADIKFERYAQRGDWRLFGSGSTGLAPFNARSLQLGVSHPF